MAKDVAAPQAMRGAQGTGNPDSTEWGADDEALVAKDVVAPDATRGAEGTGGPESTE